MLDQLELESQSENFRNPWIAQPIVTPCDEIDEWISALRSEVRSRFQRTKDSYASVVMLIDDAAREDDRAIFRELVSQWKKETWFISTIKKRVLNDAYLKIIGLGKAAVPWILDELRREPDYWSYALEAITRENPAKDAETLSELRDAWLSWGIENGY